MMPEAIRRSREKNRAAGRSRGDRATRSIGSVVDMRFWGKAIGSRAVAMGTATCAVLGLAGAASAETYGHAEPGQIGFQPPVTEIARYIEWFHNDFLLPMTAAISLFVLGLLIYVVVRFNEKANPTPSKTTHNTAIEVAWTIIPIILLVIMAMPSFRLLTKELEIPPADLTIKVTGIQWNWEYSYPQDKDQSGFTFDSYIKSDKELGKDDIRLLAVDNEAVVPVGKIVKVIVTAKDVIHSFVVQSFGIRVDAVPGRLNETWFKADREGVYYGQCSKLCGKDHAFMPIAFRVVSEEKYEAWLADSRKKFASADSKVDVADSGAVLTRP
jgi:cytochrome c oxidase subunit 2